MYFIIVNKYSSGCGCQPRFRVGFSFDTPIPLARADQEGFRWVSRIATPFAEAF